MPSVSVQIQGVRPGAVIDGRFRLEQEIARGGTSRVFRARDESDGSTVALKLVTCPDRDAQARFAREVAVLARVSHPGIVRSIADGTIDERERYLALSWIDGIDLAARLRRPEAHTNPDAATMELDPAKSAEIDIASTTAYTLSVAETLRLGRRIAQALGALHSAGWVHRDIKPGNIVLRGGGVDDAVLVDLGTARAGVGVEDVTLGGMIVGTPSYMSPEQASASPRIGPESDVWSLGCVLYHALTGATPFEGGPLLAVLARIITEEPTPIATFRADVPDDLVDLVSRMLSKEPEGRPADGHAVDAELAVLEERHGGRKSAVPIRRELAKRERRARSVLVARSDDPTTAVIDRIAEIARDSVDEIHTLADGSVLIRVVRDATALDRARRAATAAVALRAALPGLRMALATEQLDDTDDDDVVTRAANLVDAAKAGAVELDAGSAELLDLHFVVTHEDGGSARLAFARSVDNARTLLGRPTPWVGRRRELTQLVSLFEECVDEPVAHAALVVGEAGIGKSRMRAEVLRALRESENGADLEVLFAQGDSLGAGAPFAMLASALRSACDVREGEPLETSRDKVRARVARVLPEEAAARVAPFIGELAGTPFPDDAHPTLGAARRDPLVMSSSTLAAWIDWLAAECARGPVTLVLDDLHWGDVPTTRFVDVALARLADRPLFVFALARPEIRTVFPALWQQRRVHEMKLEGLSKKAATSLAREALGARVPAEMIDALVDRAGGNAFFLEELIRSVADGAEQEQSPSTVLAILHARLGALGEGAKRVLCAASIFGEIFTAAGARALVGDPVQAFTLDEWLGHLVEREVLVRDGDSFKFRHALVRDAAYDLLTREDRTAGHLAAAGWLEQTKFAEPLALAEQFIRGGEPRRAVRWFRRAAEQALEGRDFEAVLRNAERAVEAGADRGERAVLRRLQAVSTYWQSRYADASRFAAEALEASEPGSRDWFLAMSELVVSSARLSDFATVEARFDEASRAEAKGDSAAEAAQIVCLCRSTFQMIFHGRFATSDEMLARIDALAGDVSRFDPLTAAQIHHVRGVRAIHAGCVSTFLEHLERAVASFEKGGDRNNVLLERTTVGWCWAELGDFALAEEKIRENFAACVAAGAQQAITYAKVNLGYALIHRPGKLAEARAMLDEAISECRAVGNARLEGWASAHASSAALAANDPAESLRFAEEAVRVLASAPGLLAWAEACVARALLALGRNDDALATAKSAMNVLERLGGMLQGEALPPLVLAEALKATGKIAEARTAARDAMARLERRTGRLGRAEWRASFAALPDHQRTRALAVAIDPTAS